MIKDLQSMPSFELALIIRAVQRELNRRNALGSVAARLSGLLDKLGCAEGHKLLPLKVFAQPSTAVLGLDGVACRLWHGIDHALAHYLLFVHRVTPLTSAGEDSLEGVLGEMQAPAEAGPWTAEGNTQ